jgi:hypothetical protein
MSKTAHIRRSYLAVENDPLRKPLTFEKYHARNFSIAQDLAVTGHTGFIRNNDRPDRRVRVVVGNHNAMARLDLAEVGRRDGAHHRDFGNRDDGARDVGYVDRTEAARARPPGPRANSIQPECLTARNIRRTQFHWLLNSMSRMALLFVRSVSRVAGATGSSLARRRSSFAACARQGANVVVSVRGVQFLQRARLWPFIVQMLLNGNASAAHTTALPLFVLPDAHVRIIPSPRNACSRESSIVVT